MTLMNQKEVAEYLGKSRWTIKRWTEKGLLPCSGSKNKSIYIKEEIERSFRIRA